MRVALGLVVGMACVGRPEKGTADPPVADSDLPLWVSDVYRMTRTYESKISIRFRQSNAVRVTTIRQFF